MRFCTVINCMDGRTQLPVIKFLQERFNAEYVDSITEPGPILTLTEQKNMDLVHSVLTRLDISVKQHNSVGLAVVAHHDCAGNPAPKENQIKQLQSSIQFLHKHIPDLEIIGLWVDENFDVHEMSEVTVAG